MTRTFIEVPLFSKRWKEIGLTDDEKSVLKKLVKALKEEASKNRR